MRAVGEALKIIDPGSSSFKRNLSDSKSLKFVSHKKTSWLFNLKEFEQVKTNKELKLCKHVDPVNPGFYFYPLASYPQKAILCVECSVGFIESLSAMSPDTCELCDTSPHKIFHEALVNVGAINIYGNICRSCSNTYIKG